MSECVHELGRIRRKHCISDAVAPGAVSCELIPGPLQEQQTHQTTETYFQPPFPMHFENYML